MKCPGGQVRVVRRTARACRAGPGLLIGAVTMIAVGTIVAARAATHAEGPSTAVAFSDDQRGYWALQPVKRPPIPQVRQAAWVRGAIDAFILSKLEQHGIAPAAEADRRTLIRRLTFDLHGLPPASDDVAAFLADGRPDAYERLVDRLLASPQYGERWGRHWLDVVRYAETDGFKSDATRPNAWRYRDYVIAAFNGDMPYDRFVTEQLAGDELAPDDPQALVATGFLRHWPYEENGRDVLAQRATILNDVTDVTGQAFLGLTIRCARCHDHKYDPIPQSDYYRLQAFFAPMSPRDDLFLGTSEERRQFDRRQAEWETATRELRDEVAKIETPVRQKMRVEGMQVFPKDVQAMLHKPLGQLSPLERIAVDLAEKQIGDESKDISGRMSKDVKTRWGELRKKLDAFDGRRPAALPVAMGIRDLGPDAPRTTIPGRATADEVSPGFLSIVDPRPAAIAPIETKGVGKSTGRRAALARWIASADNPLTARVMVNRLWQNHFGRGLVATPGDFGLQGERPTHPELLDYLARELIDGGWRLKHLHRRMVTSAAYRQSSLGAPSERAIASDPQNRWLWRMRMARVESEILRDGMLAASGELNLHAGGPSVRPELPKELNERYGWIATPDVHEQNRRSVYVFIKRNMSLPLLAAFDTPDTHESCSRRDVTTTAPQALMLLNDRWAIDRARALAGRLLGESGVDHRQLIDRAYQATFGRSAEPAERAAAEKFVDEQSTTIRERLSRKEPIALPTHVPSGYDPARAAAWVDYCHILLNANEFVYVD